MNEESTQHVLGIVGDILAVLYFGAPIASIAHVFRSGSTEVLPFPIIFSLPRSKMSTPANLDYCKSSN